MLFHILLECRPDHCAQLALPHSGHHHVQVAEAVITGQPDRESRFPRYAPGRLRYFRVSAAALRGVLASWINAQTAAPSLRIPDVRASPEPYWFTIVDWEDVGPTAPDSYLASIDVDATTHANAEQVVS